MPSIELELNETRSELERTKQNQIECIELGDFVTAGELEHDISYLKGLLGDLTAEYTHLI